MDKPLQSSLTSVAEYRLLSVIDSLGSDYTGGLAADAGVPLSTARRALERLEERGVIRGIKHDERNTGGRIRIYWSRA